jgi:WXG100 family type VII secretion target
MSDIAFKAGAGALGRAAGMVSRAHEDLDVLAGQLAGKVETHLGGWSGAGATAFTLLHETWQTKHRQITAVLSDLESSLRQTDQQATQRDAEARAAVQRVAGQLELGRL